MQSMDRIQFSIRLLLSFVLFATIKYFYTQYTDFDESINYLMFSVLIDLTFVAAITPFIITRLQTIKLSCMLVSLFYLNILLSTNFNLLIQQLLKYQIAYLLNFSLIVNVLSLILLLYLCLVKKVGGNVTLTRH